MKSASRRRLVLCSVFLAALLVSVPPAHAHPKRGSVKWSVILCTFSDSPAPPHDPAYYRNMFFNPGTGGMADYWASVSDSGINFQGSVVVGWYAEPFTIAQAQAQDRWTRFQSCVSAAQNAAVSPYTVPAGNLIAIVTSPGIDLFGYIGYGSFLPDTVDMGGMTHEVGHGLGYQHSFSDDPNFRDASWAQIGEYDDEWDAMSWANAYGSSTANYGYAAPGMNAAHADQMGWLRRDQIMTFGADGVGSRTVTLVPLYSTQSGIKLVRIPFDPGDLMHYYTVEYRSRAGYDAGIPASIVMIHEWKKGDRDPTDQYLSYLIRAHSGNRDPINNLSANGVTIAVNSIAPNGQSASVTISSQIAGRCVQGYVWREARPSDHVCVTGAVRSQASQDNAQAASRRNPNGGPFGPDTCLQGFVWREAFTGDHVCVVPAVRSQAVDDNQHAAERINPARLAYGPNTCQQGYVWREADGMDYVCVTGATRSQTRQDNAQAASRRNPNGGPFGPDTCLQGYVWREAFPGDHVCVTGAVRSQAADDNSHAEQRVQAP
jgi:hypothetical protein